MIAIDDFAFECPWVFGWNR